MVVEFVSIILLLTVHMHQLLANIWDTVALVVVTTIVVGTTEITAGTVTVTTDVIEAGTVTIMVATKTGVTAEVPPPGVADIHLIIGVVGVIPGVLVKEVRVVLPTEGITKFLQQPHHKISPVAGKCPFDSVRTGMDIVAHLFSVPFSRPIMLFLFLYLF